MSKYDYGMSLPNDGSNRWAFDTIREGSTVLEFGPAVGQLTKHLKESKHCIVDIVEIDEESGKCAARYADRALIGSVYGDIQSFRWEKTLCNRKYDAILFLDVLEHLMYPQQVLEHCQTLLKENGSIFLSIPNIAHNGVILSLCMNHFEYQKLGILDNTHVRFFAHDTVEKMAHQAGYCITEKKYVRKPAGKIEIESDYSDVPEDVASYLRSRENNEVFQFLFRLQLQGEEATFNYPQMISSLYYDLGEGFLENQKIEADFYLNKNKFQTSFSLTDLPAGIKALRWDPPECVYMGLRIDSSSFPLVPKSGFYHYNGYILFTTMDPEFSVLFSEDEILKSKEFNVMGAFFRPQIRDYLQAVEETNELIESHNMQTEKVSEKEQIESRANILSTSFYLDRGNGYSEQEKIYVEAPIIDKKFIIKAKIDTPETIRGIRWDPVERQMCTFFNITFSSNLIPVDDGNLRKWEIRCLDPQMELRFIGKTEQNEIIVTGEVEFPPYQSAADLEVRILQIMEECDHLFGCNKTEQ